MTDHIPLAKHKSELRDKQRAKTLQKEAPLSERLLWESLREAAKTEGLRFRRQHPIPPYIVDFICLKARLVIEADGASHDMRLEQDKERDGYLKSRGYEVIRISNQDVRENLENIISKILYRARELIDGLYIPLP